MRIRESIIFDYPFMGFRFFEPLRDNRIQEFLFVQPFFFHIQTDIPLCLLFGREVGHVNPAKRNVLVVKNETRILEQKRKVIQKFQ